ncbi:unnamed protein product [Caenorhabditis auriculariae]|uniref:GPS domain-containing protein n=1 Tax=Caenorhabditis auriculariae TaxID=2777116 RepID=A0A8S1HCB4_9PELO|nr:unnamed protein product [Caenorhabditis auriculariae]
MDAPSSCVQQTLLTEDSPVMSATVLNNGQQIHAASTEETMAVLRFDISKLQNPLHGTFRVTWWDIEKETWAVNQPCTIISVKDGILEARCIHLTDFTLIVDGAVDDPIVCDSALEGVGLATNLISIISLVFLCALSLGAYTHTMTRTSFYRYVNGNSLPKQDVVATVYHFDLLLFYLLFAFFSNESIAGRACDEMAAITYALLVWTILPFVPIFFRPFFNAFLAPPAVISVSLTLPFMLSLFLLVFTNFFDRDDSFCWVRPDYVVYAIVVPVSILVLNGIMCTMFLVYKVFLNKTRKFSRVLNHQHDPQMKSKIIGMIFMQISLGMPWVSWN